MRVVLKNCDITNISYNVNGYQDKPTQDMNNIYGSYSNKERSKMIFKLNLIAILGLHKFKNQKTINIKVVSIKAIFEDNQNIIDTTSSPILRTSNIYMNGFHFLNNKNENIIGQFTNFNPNEEILIENVFFHRADTAGSFTHIYRKDNFNVGVFERLVTDCLESTPNNPSLSLLKYKMISPGLPSLNNKIMRGSAITTITNFTNVKVSDAYDGSLPEFVALSESNQRVSIQVLPENNQWFNKKYTDDIYEDNSNLELTAYMPTNHNIELTFELRDIQNNKLQSCVTEPNNKIYPSIQFILDIN